MKNTHLHHPEDSILTGDLSVLKWFTSKGKLSVKIDGSPAIVWGTNPATGNFFVGTKSVFNKIKIMINESHDDIEKNHGHIRKVAHILHACFNNLPKTDKIYQGDFVGYGGDNVFQPNTIAYAFPYIIDKEIIIAPHTEYTIPEFGYTQQEKGDLRHAVAHPVKFPMQCTYEIDTSSVYWFKPWVEIDEHLDDIEDICDFARVISGAVDFATVNEAKNIMKKVNCRISEGIPIIPEEFDNPNLMRLWLLVKSIKDDLMQYIGVDEEVECYIHGEEVGHEGIVMTNEFGTFKLIDREIFSRANFNRTRV